MTGEALKCNSSLTELNLSSDEMEWTETKQIEMKQMNSELSWRIWSKDDKRRTEM